MEKDTPGWSDLPGVFFCLGKEGLYFFFSSSILLRIIFSL